MNRRREEVGYTPFAGSQIINKGILPLESDGGDLERRVASGLARIADEQIQKAQAEAEIAGRRAGMQAAMNGAPSASKITGGQVTGTASVNGQAGHVKGAQGGVRVTLAPQDIRNTIIEAAKKHGVDEDTMLDIARIESGYNANASNPKSSAGGLYQFIDSTAREYGVANKFDPTQAADGAARLTRANATSLKNALGRDATPGELYLAHQQGAGGAIKLLSNPNARATEIVGNDAVVNNGGSADMTAAQFASLWTSKVHVGNGNAVVSALPESRTAAVSITPVQTPMEIVPGKAGTFKPSNSNTIFGRAYDVAGTRTYLELAKQTILEDSQAVYDKYKEDPTQLNAALDQLLEAHKKEGTYFPEIAPEYEMSFKERKFDLVQRSQAQLEQRKKEQDQVDFLNRVSGFEDQKSRLMADIDPHSPTASQALADMQGTIDAHYDSAVSRGIMSPADAARAKTQSRSGTVTNFYLGQTKGLRTTELQALQSRMTEDYAAGKLSGVTAGDWDQINSGLSGAVLKSKTADDQAASELKTKTGTIFEKVLRGDDTAAADMASLRTDARVAPNGEQAMQSAEARARLASALRTLPVGEVEKQLDTILKGSAGKADPVDIEFAREQITETRKKLSTDPIGVAEQFGIIPPSSPIQLTGIEDPQQLRDSLASRRNAAVAAAQHFGVPVRYFRPGEADQVVQQAMQNPDAMVAFTLNVQNAFGKETPRAMREISENGPVMAHAVGVSIATGDPSLARDIAAVSVMKQKKEWNGKTVERGQASLLASTQLDGALFSQPQVQGAAIDTANLLFEKMAAERGYDPAKLKDPASPEAQAYKMVLDRALGGQVIDGEKYGGLGTFNDRSIVVPGLMKTESVESLVYGMGESQLAKLPPIGTANGVKVTADQIKDGYLVSVGDGLYRVTTNDPESDEAEYLIKPNGEPWVLDIRALEKIAKENPEPVDDDDFGAGRNFSDLILGR